MKDLPEPAKANPATDLRMEREFAASRERVFRAWTEPKALAQWCFPAGFTVPFAEAEFRDGGPFRTCLKAPDGTEHWVRGVYREVRPHDRLVFTHAWEDADGNTDRVTTVTLTFTALGPKRCRLVLEQTGLASVASRDGHAGGWGETLDNLERFLGAAE